MGEKLKKILVVEDEKPIAKAMELKLNSSGFEAKVAFNGKEALEALKKEQFDLVILDLIMPEMDGFTTLAEIKKKNIKTKVIVSSNLSQEEDFKKAKQLGAVDFFIKSDTPISEIVENIKKYLD